MNARAAAILIILQAAGRLTAGIFPCDAGCPATDPSFGQTVHNLAAMVSGLLGLIFLLLLFANITTRHYDAAATRHAALGHHPFWRPPTPAASEHVLSRIPGGGPGGAQAVVSPCP
jgi:hypothetical protein